MDISHAQRAEAALTQMLASVGDCSASELRRDLGTSKAIESKLAAYQSRAAATLAALERHGDGGAGVLRHATGVSRRRAQSQARTARVLEDMPAVREALEDGRVTFANAARLAQAAEGTGSGAVEADASLLANAESMTDDRFAREARRWTASHQRDDGEADYQKRRARRWLRLWDGDDGMTQLRGELDPVTGERIRNRLEAEARRLRRSAGRGGDGDGGDGDGKPTFAQAMADSLDGLTAIGSSVGGFAGDGDPNSRGNGSASGTTRERNPDSPTNDHNTNAHGITRERNPDSPTNDHNASTDGTTRERNPDSPTNSHNASTDGTARERNPDNPTNDHNATADDVCESGGAGAPAGEANPGNRDNDDTAHADSVAGGSVAGGSIGTGVATDPAGARRAAEGGHSDGTNTGGSRRGNGAGGGSGDTRDRRTSASGDSDCSCGRRKANVRPIADIAVVSHVDSATGDLVSQLATGEPLPPSVLEMLACNAAITGVLYDTAGTPLWRGTTKRTATAAQLKALIARDGGCVGCGCHPALCQAHHIRPASQGGPTTISNMVLLCWHCHQRVHHNQWTVARRHGRFEVLPPVRTRWGPARAP